MRTASSRAKKLPGPSAARWRSCKIRRYAKRLRTAHDLRLSCHMTVLEVLQSTTGYFQKRNIDSPRLNAEHLLAHVLGRKRIDLYLEFERRLPESELSPFRELVKRRGVGGTIQHLLCTVGFC